MKKKNIKDYKKMFQISVWQDKKCKGKGERLTTRRWDSWFRQTYGLIMLIIKSSFSAWLLLKIEAIDIARHLWCLYCGAAFIWVRRSG